MIHLDVVSTAYQPRIKIVFNKLLKATKNLPDKEENLAELIDVKGMKSQGNQITKLKVKEIVLDHPIEGDEPWPEQEEVTTEEQDNEDNNEDGPTEVEWDMTKKDEGNDQPTLF